MKLRRGIVCCTSYSGKCLWRLFVLAGQRVRSACNALQPQTMPSRLRAYDVFVHSGSPIDLIVRHLLPGVHVDLDTFKVFFDYVWSADGDGQLGAFPERAHHTGCLSGWDHPPFSESGPANTVCAVSRDCMLRRLVQDRTSAFVTWSCQEIQNLTKASQVEYGEPFLLPQVGSPGLAPIQESADHTGIIECHLGFSGQLRVVPYSRGETARVVASFPNQGSKLTF